MKRRNAMDIGVVKGKMFHGDLSVAEVIRCHNVFILPLVYLVPKGLKFSTFKSYLSVCLGWMACTVAVVEGIDKRDGIELSAQCD